MYIDTNNNGFDEKIFTARAEVYCMIYTGKLKELAIYHCEVNRNKHTKDGHK